MVRKRSDLSSSQEVLRSVWVDVWVDIVCDFRKTSHKVLFELNSRNTLSVLLIAE